MDNESVNLPSTPSSSAFRECQEITQKVEAKQEKTQDTKRRKEDESIQEVTTSADKTVPGQDDVYEVIKTNDTEYIDNEDDGVVIEHDTASVKTSVKNENKSLTTSMEKISGDIQSEYSETNIT